ncbi:hypothetical protein WA158_007927, partial [Blastocystis sp. Blastoise]
YEYIKQYTLESINIPLELCLFNTASNNLNIPTIKSIRLEHNPCSLPTSSLGIFDTISFRYTIPPILSLSLPQDILNDYSSIFIYLLKFMYTFSSIVNIQKDLQTYLQDH